MGFTGKRRAGARPRRGSEARVLRIIGGAWRGRKLRFPDVAQLRPTPDRVRETLFNWLGAKLPGARCLDLFAGSGALGLEALSRGAAAVCFVEHDAHAVRELKARLAEWGAQGASVQRAEALTFLASGGEPCDVVFLDPPFASALLGAALPLLTAHGWLRPAARVYVEGPARAGLPPLPAGLELLRSGQAGAVGYHLLGYAAASLGSP